MSDTGASPISHQPAHVSRVSNTNESEAAQLQAEMRRIALRRQQMSEQRAQLHPSSTTMRPVSAQGSSQRSRSALLVEHDPPGATHVEPISEEFKRRERLPRTASREMKEAMKQSWQRDSTLVSGFFLTKETNKGGTWGRAQRFTNPVGHEHYYLSNQVQTMQSRAVRLDRHRYVVATRGNIGTNVNSHWNDPRGGCAPGPGAYTPRWAVTSSGPRGL